jgi:hypothetical protein
MADNTTPQGADNSAALQADEGTTIPRLRLGEVGFSALKQRGGRIMEEANMQFQMPYLAKVIADMSYSPAVSIGLGAINTLISRSQVAVEPVVGETPVEKVRREYLLSVLHDMENSFQSTLQNIATSKEWGHQVSEIVLGRRLWSKGSKHNDGLIRVTKLAHRPQATLIKWNYDESGRNLLSVSQSIANVENSYRFQSQTDSEGLINIPREKFLLFRSDATSDNPHGASCLKSVYLAWKQLTLLEEHMLRGVAKDTSGIPYAQLPIKFLDPNASAEDKAVYTTTKQILDEIADGVSRSIIMPTLRDDQGNDLFSLTLMEQKGGKAYDLPLIIRQLQANILSVLSADSITMGADKSGSMSLQDSDTNMLALRVSFLLSQVSDTLNQELVPLLWRMNGWTTDRMPQVYFKDVSSVSLEEFSKFFQRVAAVGGIEYTRDVFNKVREVGGFDLLPDDEPVDVEKLSTTMAGKASGSGAGLAVGANGDGTAKAPGGQDNSVKNSENKA